MTSLDLRAIDESDLRDEPCPVIRHELRVIVCEPAFDRAVARGNQDTGREIGGVLVGELLRDAAGPYLRIDGTIDALHAEEKTAELTFTHATWQHIHQEMDSSHRGKRVVGWYHTHPGFGVFLSDRDQFIHNSFFNLPFQVAFVYDPKSREHGMFGWRANEICRLRRYWIGAREQTWDGEAAGARAEPGPRAIAREPGDQAPARAPAEPLAPPSTGALIVIGLSLLLIGGFAGHWIGSASGHRALASAELQLVKARSDGEQLAIAALQRDLVGILRDTLGDQAVRAPVGQAIRELDAAIAAIDAGAGPGSGSGSGSSGSSGGGSGGSGAGPGSASSSGADPRVSHAAAQLRALRGALTSLSEARSSAHATLTALEHASQRTADLRADLAREVAVQRAGLGRLYAELARDAVAAGDAARGRRLLEAAAQLDPGNRARYQTQLRTFDRSAVLPAVPGAGGDR